MKQHDSAQTNQALKHGLLDYSTENTAPNMNWRLDEERKGKDAYFGRLYLNDDINGGGNLHAQKVPLTRRSISNISKII